MAKFSRFLQNLIGETVKMIDGRVNVLAQREREALRHILIGSPEAIRQAIHQLHVLHYAESLLWSPISSVGDRIILTPTQGEAMSLLRR